MAGSIHDVDLVNNLFKRQCIECPNDIKPVCPNCGVGKVCTLTSQSCTSCPKSMCIDTQTGQLEDSPSEKKPNMGAIGGGVVAALIVITIIAYLSWRSIKRKRQLEREIEANKAEKNDSFGMLRSGRGSIASTTTRASNVIQIGFIPGVNGRSAPSTPGHFIPPVPPLPAGSQPNTPTIRYPQSPAEGTFFSAEDILRASFCTTDDHNPRASVATTIYRNNAVVQPVAANVVRAGKAAVVQVKAVNSPAATPHLGSAPPVPDIDPSHFGKSLGPVPPSPAFSVGSTFLNKMSERNQEVEPQKKIDHSRLSAVPIQRRPVPGRAVTATAVAVDSSVWDDSDDDDDEPRHRRLTVDSRFSCDTTEFKNSPFSDTQSLSDIPLPHGAGMPPMRSPVSRNFSATVAPPRNSNASSQRGRADVSGTPISERRMSPFDDSNAVAKDKGSI